MSGKSTKKNLEIVRLCSLFYFCSLVLAFGAHFVHHSGSLVLAFGLTSFAFWFAVANIFFEQFGWNIVIIL